MSALHEMASAVKARRDEMGLSQERLAQLSGLSRTTVNQLEQGSISDLSINRASRLLAVLGINLQLAGARRERPARRASMTPLERAAVSASVSFRDEVTAQQLKAILKGKPSSPRLQPHLRSLLEDAPVSLLAAVARQLEDQDSVPAPMTWKRMRDLARDLRGSRDLWL